MVLYIPLERIEKLYELELLQWKNTETDEITDCEMEKDNLESFLLQNQSNLIIPFMTILQVLHACTLGCVGVCVCILSENTIMFQH